MAYGRRYRYSRSRYSRRRRTLSTSRVLTSTSARAQSRQILALNRRISAIQRRTKPEIRVAQPNPYTYAPTGSTTDGYGWTSQYFVSPANLQGVTMDQLEGYMCRLLSCTVYFNANYTSISATVQPITYRVTIIQTKAGVSQTAIEFNDVFNYDGSSSYNWYTTAGVVINTTNSQTAVFGPLQNNITRFARVLYDNKFVLSYQRPQVNRTIRVKPSTLYSVSGTGNQGAIYVCVVAYAPSNAHTYRVAAKLALTDS